MTDLAVFQIVPTAPGKPKGGLNCGCCIGASCVIHATAGQFRPSGEMIRDLCRNPDGSPDVSGGTNLRQIAAALLRGYGVVMDVRTPEEYAAFRSRMTKDRGLFASVSVGYGAFVGTHAYASRTGFRSNHQVGVRWVGGSSPWELYDPLADGKRGAPKAPVRITDALLRKAAAALVVNAHIGKTLGLGLIYAGTVSAPKPPPPVPVKWAVRFGTKAFWVYGVQNGVAIQRTPRQFAKATSAPCEAKVPVVFSGTERQLVKVTKGTLAGSFVEPGRSRLELVSL